MALVVAFLCILRGGAGQMIPDMPYKDPDDAMRMLQVLALRDGADWFDMTQPRLNPPDGVVMHWSRLPDLPILGTLALTEPVLGRDQAMVVSAVAVPVLLGVAFFIAFVWAAVALTGRDGAVFAGLIGLVLNIPLMAFQAGRIDHHGWQLLLAVIGAGALLRVAAGRPSVGASVAAGVAGALGLWVGAEAIPAVAVGAAVLTLSWLRAGQQGADHLALFGVSLAAATSLIVPAALAPGQWGSRACDSFSLLSVALGWALALFGVGAALIERVLRQPTWPRRAVAGGLLGAALIAVLYTLFPNCAGGPYAGISPEAALLVSRVSEAQPMWIDILRRPGTAAQFLSLPLLALVISTWQSVQGAGARRTLWLAATLLVAGGILLQFWQLRASFLANVYAGLVLCWWAAAVGAKIDQTPGLLPRLLRRAGPALIVLLLPGTASLLAQTLSGRPEEPPGDPCDLQAAAAVLNRPPYSDQGPMLIAAPINVGASLLLLTPHQVLAAPYHRNTGGLKDIALVFYRDEATAKAAVDRRGVDLLLLCKDEPVATHERGKGTRLFYDQLLQGDVPDWLEPIAIDGSTRLFRVIPPSERAGA